MKEEWKETDMKAIVYPQYGSPDVLELKEVEKPTPQDGQLLIKVHAASVNALDWRRFAMPSILVRLMGGGLLKPKNQKLGADVAGTVEAVGRSVTEFKPGDEVFGVAPGSFAEYACNGASKFALKPANVSFEAAAAVPVAAFTALQGLRDKGRIQAGQKVMKIFEYSMPPSCFSEQNQIRRPMSSICKGISLALPVLIISNFQTLAALTCIRYCLKRSWLPKLATAAFLKIRKPFFMRLEHCQVQPVPGGYSVTPVNAMAHLIVGHENVSVYDGSMSEWVAEGLPTAVPAVGKWEIWRCGHFCSASLSL
jgi:hypothetical protein